MRRLTVLADGLAVVVSKRGLLARVALAALAAGSVPASAWQPWSHSW
jgi:hypothetical protein